MKNKIRILTLAAFLLLLIAISCDKDKSYPKDSIAGTWRCFEEGTAHGYRQYDVSIDYQGKDSTLIIIYNFYKLGYQVETFASIEDTIITIMGTNTADDISGTGHFERDFSAIYWKFSYFGQSSDPMVESAFRRP